MRNPFTVKSWLHGAPGFQMITLRRFQLLKRLHTFSSGLFPQWPNKPIGNIDPSVLRSCHLKIKSVHLWQKNSNRDRSIGPALPCRPWACYSPAFEALSCYGSTFTISPDYYNYRLHNACHSMKSNCWTKRIAPSWTISLIYPRCLRYPEPRKPSSAGMPIPRSWPAYTETAMKRHCCWNYWAVTQIYPLRSSSLLLRRG